MLKRLLFCEVCGRDVEHMVDGDDDDCGELALCTSCGRLSTVPARAADHAPRQSQHRRTPESPCNSRPR